MNAIDTAGKAPGRAETDQRVVIIAGDNTWVHMYPDVKAMLDCSDALAATPGPLDFFDVRGRRLGPVFSRTWRLEGLQGTADAADPAMVERRLCAVIKSVRAEIKHRLETEPNPPDILRLALSRLPELDGRALPECFAMLEPDFGDGQAPGDAQGRHDGGFLHNLLCH